MMKKASLHGLAFKNDVDLDGDVVKSPHHELVQGVHARRLFGVFASRFYRMIGAEPEQAEDGAHTTVNVFHRCLSL